MFGLFNLPEGVPTWGARAIFQRGLVDIVPNRQQWLNGKEDAPRKALAARINLVMPFVKEKAKELRWSSLAGDAAKVVRLYDYHGLIVEATTNASHGYLYIVAYATDLEVPKTGQWSGQGSWEDNIPSLGAVIPLRTNMVNSAKVVGYFEEYGWIGLRTITDVPGWYVKQNGADCPYHVFGMDLDPELSQAS